jgi:serine/threonine protein kinase
MSAVDTPPARFGPYLVYEQLGKGGMATVHRAETTTKVGTRQVALKRLLPTLNREIVQLFLDEARLHRYLHHANIAETYDSGKVFGTYFIAMEYVKGPTLKELVAHCGETVGAVPQPITLNLAAQLCDALDHAHNQADEHGNPLGIVHRDITPSNMILSDTGLLKLIDFGLAKTKVSSEETAQGVIKGKFGYVAPEYLGGHLDHRADLWAVGIIMYELLTSRRLFDGADAFETMTRIRNLPIPRPSIGNPRVTPELDEIVMTALERNPEKRWQSAANMRSALRRVLEQPGNEVDNQHVIDWVNWVFTQKPGTEVSGVARLSDMLRPQTVRPSTPAIVFDPKDPLQAADIVSLPPPPPLTPWGIVWFACAIAVTALLAGAIVWRIVG